MTWAAVLTLSAGAYLLKLLGVVVLPKAPAVQRLMPLVALLPPALLMALVVVNTVGDGRGGLVLDERVAGLAVAALLVWRRASFVVVVAGSAAATALLRAL